MKFFKHYQCIINDIRYVRIPKNKAERLYNDNIKIAVIAGELTPYFGNGMFLIDIQKSDCSFVSFEMFIANFRYYNCRNKSEKIRYFFIEI